MNVLNILISGGAGGIETLCNNIDKFSSDTFENHWFFLHNGGFNYESIFERNPKRTFLLESKNIFSIFYKIKKYILSNDINIIVHHHEGLFGDVLYLMLKKRFPKLKFVRTIHSCYSESLYMKKNIFYNSLYHYIISKTLQLSDLIICVSFAVKNSFINEFKFNTKIDVVYNGIDNKFYKGADLKKDNLLITYVGRLSPEKGVSYLLNAMNILINDKHLDVKLNIIGDGLEMNNLNYLCSKFNLTNHITFFGNQKNVETFLSKSSLFVYPSICDEAFGISVVEAMASGCVPIAFNKGGLGELINDSNGFLISDVSYLKLADMIETALMENLSKKRNNSINDSRKFTIINTIKELETKYNKLLKE